MGTRIKDHRNARVLGRINQASKVANRLKIEGSHPSPAQLGWGQHKSRKDRISLFNPWRQP